MKDELNTSYKVDIKNQRVLQTFYDENKPSNILIHEKEKCDVFDEKNWKCNSYSGNEILWSFEMIDGKLRRNEDYYSRSTNEIYITKRNFWGFIIN